MSTVLSAPVKGTDMATAPAGTFFFNRTVYFRGTMPVPDCFLRLDQHFGAKGLTAGSGFDHPTVALAENLCRRMGDVDFHAEAIELTLDDGTDPRERAAVIGAHLVAHFGACKSVLDAAAVALNDIFELGHYGGRCDLKQDSFWDSLAGTSSVTANQHAQLRPTIRSIVEWRDAAVHRVAPLTMPVRARDSQGNVLCDAQGTVLPVTVQLCLEPDIAVQDLASYIRTGSRSLKWGHPLYFHRAWRDSLVSLCENVCTDIATIV